MKKKIFCWIRNFFLFFLLSTIGMVVIYRFLPVYFTPLMVSRMSEELFRGEFPTFYHRWVPLEEMSKSLPLAVVASEDNLFMEHSGFDFVQIKKAVTSEKRDQVRGASTISQQTAKNVFLWSGRSYIRKGLEGYFTVLIELIWGKERIMEVYLNSIEMGTGVYGAEAVARQHFNTSAAHLSRSQCALIAATLPNPRRFNSAHPSAYMRKRQAKISSLMGKIAPVKFD